MFGRNGVKPRPAARSALETDSLVISQGGFFNGNVAKIREPDAPESARPVHRVEDKRVGAHG